jgi:hypothetical protein
VERYRTANYPTENDRNSIAYELTDRTDIYALAGVEKSIPPGECLEKGGLTQ